ncbi:hypothetical protein [Bacillus thuringiensis]|uniref:hypothetical protein n=1 Tax=Bacillus thuringiensis TaxID=1428 RepID=UPI000BF8ABF2|nr:hypothetical protein [Bacillus thuringiensis]PFN38133.1 hypothetical protein COJ56_21195 [Bacillus thuringiensis]
MDKQKGLELLNGLVPRIQDYDADGEILYYAYVEVTDENESIIKSLLPKGVEFEDGMACNAFDLTLICWEYAEWFDGEQFLSVRPE